MQELIYVNAVAVFFLLSGLAHILRPVQTEKWMSNRKVVRLVGACLVLFALPCFLWRGWFFRTLFVLLLISGVWRLCFPKHSIRSQQRVYPRRVHALLLIGGALLIWALAP